MRKRVSMIVPPSAVRLPHRSQSQPLSASTLNLGMEGEAIGTLMTWLAWTMTTSSAA